jgi:hypothetical protein
MNIRKPKMPKIPKVKSNIHHAPKVKAHPTIKVKAKRGKALSGKTSSHFDKHIPVRAAKGHKGGKTKPTAQENPFGAGEVIPFGTS